MKLIKFDNTGFFFDGNAININFNPNVMQEDQIQLKGRSGEMV